MITRQRNLQKLSEICEIFSGGTPSTKIKEYWNGNISWLSSGETRNNFIVDTERKITLDGVKNSSTRLAKKNDVVVASAGQGNTRGQVSLCLIDTYVNQSVLVIRTNNEIILPKFLFYNLKSRYAELRQISDSHSLRGSLPKNVLSIIDMILPSLPQQEKIGKILYDLDLEIVNLQNQNKILEQITQSIYKSWFIDFDGVKEFEDSELGQIPKGWIVDTLESICEIFSGGTPSTLNKEYWNGDIFWLSSGETRNRFIIDTERKITTLGVENSSTRLSKKYDVVVASAGQGNTRGQVSLCLIDTYINQSVIVLRSKINFKFSYFVFCNLKSRYDQLRRLSDSSSSRGSLPKNIIITIKTVIPDDKILKKFNELVNPMIMEIERNLETLSKLSKTRDILLPKLMSGEIRV